MKRYLIGITFDEKLDIDDSTRESRERFVLQNVEKNVGFQNDLHKWLVDQGVEDQIEGFDEALMFPILSIKCTTEVAELIDTYPGVDFVRPDGISSVR